MKKTISLLAITAVAIFVGGILSYVKAAYIEPSANAPAGNTPAPILLSNEASNSAYIPFRKLGKLGITDDINKAIDADQFTDSTLVVMGQTASNGLSVSGLARIFAELETTATVNPLFVGDPTNASLLQTDGNGKIRLFTTNAHTRAPRIVVGSKSVSPAFYNLFIAEGAKATNLGKSTEFSNYSLGQTGYTPSGGTAFCTLTANDLRDKGCPSVNSGGVYKNTYLSQVIPGSGTDVVARCNDLVTTNTSWYPYSNYNKGSCY